MEVKYSVDIEAPPERVWDVMIDVSRWPEWTKSVSKVTVLGGGPLRRDSRVRISQPRLPSADWKVTRFEPGREFVWQTGTPLFKSVATHTIEPSGEESRVTLSASWSGPLASAAGRLFLGRAQSYVEEEARGLKRRVEEEARGLKRRVEEDT